MKLEVRGVCKSYGNVIALDNADFDLSSGGIIGFIGANGAGKTTALRIMSGLEEPDSGDVTLDGVSIVDYPDLLRHRIGFMPDLLSDTSDIQVRDYLEFFIDSFIYGTGRRKKFDEVVEFTRVGDFLQRKLSDLSKGMKQRVQLARLLIHDPELLLLDEPAAGLDPRGRAELHEMLKELAGMGKTVFLSSHILAELENMISGVVIIDRGRILRSGSLNEISRPGNPGENGGERVEIECLAGVTPQLIGLLKSFPGVTAVYPDGAKGIVCEIADGGFNNFMVKLGENGFPLGALRRVDRVVGLDKLFFQITAGGGR